MVAKEASQTDKTLIKSCMFEPAGLVLGKTQSKMAKILLSDSINTIKIRIDGFAKDIGGQVLDKL